MPENNTRQSEFLLAANLRSFVSKPRMLNMYTVT